jgi:rare lipoprotein A
LTKTISAVCALIGCAFIAQTAPAHSKDMGCSTASHYGIGDGYHGQRTASGERFNAYGLTAAHRTLPFGTKLKVTDQSTGKSVIVRVNDRGPYIYDRSIDLSYGAFSAIKHPGAGVTRVCIAKI